MKNIWIIVLAVAAVAVGGYLLVNRQTEKTPINLENEQMEKAAESILAGEEEIMKESKIMETGKVIMEPEKNIVVITYENNVFTPSVTKVKIGDTVKFDNKHTFAIRVSSNPHPIHTSYSKLESNRLEPGQSYEFIASEKVTISYHNHFNPNAEGKIVVE